MTPKQRFEKKLSNLFLSCDEPIENFDSVMQVKPGAVRKLLLAEHRRVRALAMGQTRYRADVNSSMTTQSDGEWINRDDLLKALGGQKEEQP